MITQSAWVDKVHESLPLLAVVRVRSELVLRETKHRGLLSMGSNGGFHRVSSSMDRSHLDADAL